MKGDYVGTNHFDLDNTLLSHFDQLDAEGRDTEFDQFQPPDSWRKKVIWALNYTTDEDSS